MLANMPAHRVVRCMRCGDPCCASLDRPSKARPFKKSWRGRCAACAVCVFFQDEENGVGHALGPDFDPAGLKLPHIQKLFAQLLITGGSELRMEEIDWDAVIRKWKEPA